MQIYYQKKRFIGLILSFLGLLIVALVNLNSEFLFFQIIGVLILVINVLLGLTLLRLIALRFKIISLTENEFIDYRVLKSSINLSDIIDFKIDERNLSLQLKSTAQLHFKTFHRLFSYLFYKNHQLKLYLSNLSVSQINQLKHQLKANCSSSSL